MTRVLVFALLASACGYPIPTAPEPVVVSKPPVSQLVIRIAGPDTWWPDRLKMLVYAYDTNGAIAEAIVSCDSSIGITEPRSFSTISHGGTWIRGVHPGAVLSCSFQNLSANYIVTEKDWRVIGGETGPIVPPVIPPVIPPGG